MLCQNPDCKTEITDGDRLLSVGFSINWGADDLRNAWHGDYAFDSFACLAAWASAKAGDHDGHVLKEGALYSRLALLTEDDASKRQAGDDTPEAA